MPVSRFTMRFFPSRSKVLRRSLEDGSVSRWHATTVAKPKVSRR